MNDHPSLKLVGWVASSTTNRVRIALAVKGISYDFENVDLKLDESRTTEHRTKYNSLSQVPILVLDDKVMLRQSVAILEYIDEEFPETPLMPKDLQIRAQVREVVEIVNSFIQPMQNKLTVEMVAKNDKVLADFFVKAIMAHAQETPASIPPYETKPELWPHLWIHKGLTAIESIVKDTAGEYCFGDNVTLADCALLPQVLGARFYHMDLSPYPTITKVCCNLAARPEVQETLGPVLDSAHLSEA